MVDNVIILGAGASHDAGIPLLSGFAERMWGYAIRGKNGDEPLSDADHHVFKKAIEVRNELDGYHGRATFDDRNIEDILSILSFNFIGGRRSDRDKFNWIVKAIARTIELSCTVRHSGRLNRIEESGPPVYRHFWDKIFNFAGDAGEMPTIITFNYDVVLERSLLQLLVNTRYDQYRRRFPFPGINLRYHFDHIGDISLRIKYVTFGELKDKRRGTTLERVSGADIEGAAEVEILKLHGSLNFPKNRTATQELPLTAALEDPLILPPIFDKLTTPAPRKMWKVALERLREAKNIVIVGYSLPQTDIYMQYFLKTAVGPNIDLNRIYVFDPVLFAGDQRAQDMVDRYLSCFAPQMRDRIEFLPGSGTPQTAVATTTTVATAVPNGTLQHFVDMVGKDDNPVFF